MSPRNAATQEARSSSENNTTFWQRLLAPDGLVRGDSPIVTYYVLLLTTLFLLILGLTMVFSVQSVALAGSGGNVTTYFLRYVAITLVGLFFMWVISRVPIARTQQWAIGILAAGIVMQGMVLVPGLGYCAGGNCNWIRVPVIGTIQPSEAIKLGLVVFLGWLIAKHGEVWENWKSSTFILPLLYIGVAVGLVLWGGDVGTVVVLAMTVAGGMWAAGLPGKWFIYGGGAGLLAFAGLTGLSANRRARIISWLNPDAPDPFDVGYQPMHARYALGTGGVAGVGPGASRQKWGYLTQAESDYIFAVIGEELGFVGALIVILGFVALGWCCLRIMRRSNDTFVTVATGALMAWLVGQALINMSVVVGLLPVLGVPLPLISAGGSSLILVLGAVGVLLAFARQDPEAAEYFAARPSAARRTASVRASARRLSFSAWRKID